MTTITPSPFRPRKIYWDELNLLGKSYLDLVKDRVRAKLRLRYMIESGLVISGLYKEVYETKMKGNFEVTGRKVFPITPIEEQDDDFKKQVVEAVKQIKEHEAYVILNNHRKRLQKSEEVFLKDAAAIYETIPVWQWCLDTKGLGPVAATTFTGFMNPDRFESIYKIYSMAGLVPKKRLKRGEQARMNPLIKSRFWLVTRNVIMFKDPYYYPLYKIKKEYYYERPDLRALKEEKPRGWSMMINKMSMRYLGKLLMSHAYDMMTGQQSHKSHRNPIPPKPSDPTKYADVHKQSVIKHALMIDKLSEKWITEGRKPTEGYKEFLAHQEYY